MKLKGDIGCVSGGGFRPAANQRNIAPSSIEEARYRSDNGWCLRRCLDGEVGSPIIFCVGDY